MCIHPFRGPFNSAVEGLTGEAALLFLGRAMMTQSLLPGPWRSWEPVCRIRLQLGLHSLCCAWAGQIAETRKWLWSQHTCRMGEATVPTLSFSTPKCQAKSETDSILPWVPHMCVRLFLLATSNVFRSLWRSVSAQK